MLILVIESGKKPVEREIDGSLEVMQAIVGGYIQVLYPFAEGIALICNDEGKIQGLPANRGLRDGNGRLYDIVCGTFFLCGAPANADHFASLTQEQVEQYRRLFWYPEIFVRTGGRLCCIPLEDE